MHGSWRHAVHNQGRRRTCCQVTAAAMDAFVDIELLRDRGDVVGQRDAVGRPSTREGICDVQWIVRVYASRDQLAGARWSGQPGTNEKRWGTRCSHPLHDWHLSASVEWASLDGILCTYCGSRICCATTGLEHLSLPARTSKGESRSNSMAQSLNHGSTMAQSWLNHSS